MGNQVRVTYDGTVMESYPMQLGGQINVEILNEEALPESDGKNGDMSKGNILLISPPSIKLADVLSSNLSEFKVQPGNYTWNLLEKGEATSIVDCGVQTGQSVCIDCSMG